MYYIYINIYIYIYIYIFVFVSTCVYRPYCDVNSLWRKLRKPYLLITQRQRRDMLVLWQDIMARQGQRHVCSECLFGMFIVFVFLFETCCFLFFFWVDTNIVFYKLK